MKQRDRSFSYVQLGSMRKCLLMWTLLAPRKLRFALKPLNVVDLMAIVPFYLELLLTLCGVDDKKLRDLRWAFLVVRILRVLRVIRIIKLGRFSSGLQTFGMTLQRSQKQLQMMTIVLLTGVVFFSTMIYFLEKDEEGTPFSSIPAAYWWCKYLFFVMRTIRSNITLAMHTSRRSYAG